MKTKTTIVIGLSVLAAVVGYIYIQSDSPSQNSGAPIVEVVVPALTEKAVTGEAAYNINCSSCHGKNATGQDGIAPPLVHIIYEPSHHGDPAFYYAVKKGVRGHHWPFGNMPPVEGISDQEIADITFYIRELQRANGIN